MEEALWEFSVSGMSVYSNLKLCILHCCIQDATTDEVVKFRVLAYKRVNPIEGGRFEEFAVMWT